MTVAPRRILIERLLWMFIRSINIKRVFLFFQFSNFQFFETRRRVYIRIDKFIQSNRLFFFFFFCLFHVGKHLDYTLGFNIDVLPLFTLYLFLLKLRFQFLPLFLENRLPFLFRAAKRYRRHCVQIFVIIVPLVHEVRTQVAFGPGFHFAQRTCKINSVEILRN